MWQQLKVALELESNVKFKMACMVNVKCGFMD